MNKLTKERARDDNSSTDLLLLALEIVLNFEFTLKKWNCLDRAGVCGVASELRRNEALDTSGNSSIDDLDLRSEGIGCDK